VKIEREEEIAEVEEAVFTRKSIKKEDLPNAHQAQHRPKTTVRCVHSVGTSLIYSGTVMLTLITSLY